MWHMLQKLICLIFPCEIAHDELINVVYLFCSDLLLFSRKFAKIVRDANRYKMVHIIAPTINTGTSLLKSAKGSSLFFFSYSYVEGIGKLFKPKTRIFRLILNSRTLVPEVFLFFPMREPRSGEHESRSGEKEKPFSFNFEFAERV